MSYNDNVYKANILSHNYLEILIWSIFLSKNSK